MRRDLTDALTPVIWAEAQIPILQQRIAEWQRKDPYEVVAEADPVDSNWELVVAYLRKPLDPVIDGDVGSIMNSVRTALDLLMFAVITNNGKKTNENQHFPISSGAVDFGKRMATFETKKWITAAEAAAITRLKPYKGGHHFLYAIHHLDIKRKHETLLSIFPNISQATITAFGVGIEPGLRYLNDKTILFRIHKSRQFRPSKGNTLFTAELILDEPSFGIDEKPAILALRNFTNVARALITEFP